MNKPSQDEVNVFLDSLRQSGITNMYGAGEYIQEMYEVDKKTAGKFLSEWMRTFGERQLNE